MNNKGMSKILGAIILIIIIAVVGFAISQMGAPTAPQDVTVYIDSQQISGDYTQPQTIEWGTVSPGNTYTRNFTVTNTGAQPVTLLLLTEQPTGTTSSWAPNNTVLASNGYAVATLNYILSTSPSAGAYTWRLLAVNSTQPTATPTTNPSATPIPNNRNITISADTNVESISISINNAANYTIANPNMRVIPFTEGSTIKLYPNFVAGYTLNGWIFQDGSVSTAPVLTLQNVVGNVEVVCESKLTPTA